MSFSPKTEIEYRTNMQNYLIAKASRLSNFNPGSRIGSLIEAIALELAKSDLETYRGFQEAILESVYNTFGFDRKPGTPSTGIIRIEYSGHTQDINIPIFEIDLFGLKFKTTSTAILPVGQTQIEIFAIAQEKGNHTNIQSFSIDTFDGRGTIIPDFLPNARIYNPYDFSGGTDFETDEERLQRFRDFIQNLGRSTIKGIKNGVLSIPGVQFVSVIDNINPYTNQPEPGWIIVYVSDGSPNPPQTLLDEVYKVVKGDPNDTTNYPGYASAGTIVYVRPIEIEPINVQYEITLIQGSSLTDTEAINIANNEIIRYINNLSIGRDVLIETLHAKILLAHKDFYDVNLLLPTSDISVPDNKLPRIGGIGGGTIIGNVIGRIEPT